MRIPRLAKKAEAHIMKHAKHLNKRSIEKKSLRKKQSFPCSFNIRFNQSFQTVHPSIPQFGCADK
jgi:hypothetical protein